MIEQSTQLKQMAFVAGRKWIILMDELRQTNSTEKSAYPTQVAVGLQLHFPLPLFIFDLSKQ